MSIRYGQTESFPLITQTRLDDSAADRAETLRRPHPQVEVKITYRATDEMLTEHCRSIFMQFGHWIVV